MSTVTKPLEELIQDLLPRLRIEVRNFVEFLLDNQLRPAKRNLRQELCWYAQSRWLHKC